MTKKSQPHSTPVVTNTNHKDTTTTNEQPPQHQPQPQQPQPQDEPSQQSQQQSVRTMASNALGSSAAGIISRCLTHPLDTIKARLQAPSSSSSSSYKGPWNVLTTTIRTEGISGLYRGFGAVVMGGTPGTIVYLCSYDLLKSKLS